MSDKDLIVGLLGPDAPDILRQTVQRHGKMLTPTEQDSVDEYLRDPEGVSDFAHQNLCSLLTDIADDFQSRRRALLLAQQAERLRTTEEADGAEEDEFEVPDEDGNPLPRGPGSLLDELDL